MSILHFLESNCGDKARKATNFRKQLIDFLKEFLIFHKTFCQDYLEEIKNISKGIYSAEQSLIIKEKILSFLAKLLLEMDIHMIEKIFQPIKFMDFLLDEIKLKKLPPTVKGGVWFLVGILYGKFPILLTKYKKQINEVIFYEFTNLLNNTKKFEFKAVLGILKSFLHLLDDHMLEHEQIKELYVYLKSLMKPLEDANSIKINKCNLFSYYLIK